MLNSKVNRISSFDLLLITNLIELDINVEWCTTNAVFGADFGRLNDDGWLQRSIFWPHQFFEGVVGDDQDK